MSQSSSSLKSQKCTGTSSAAGSSIVSSSPAAAAAATACENSLNLDFTPFETIHQWKRMLECDEFVGAR